MNDDQRRIWILNDEGLYNWYRESRLSMKQFIKENRVEIDKAVSPIVSGEKPSHYLVYGG